MSTAPGLKALVTSRQVLRVYGEQEYLVPPLAVPDLERTMEIAEEVAPTLRAKALNAAGSLAFIQGEYERGKLFNREALALFRALGDEINSAWALIFLASQCIGSLSEIKEGIALTEEALALFRAQDNEAGIIRALNLLGELVRLDGDYDRAGKAYEECIVRCKESGDRLREAYTIGNLGLVAQHQGNYEKASITAQG